MKTKKLFLLCLLSFVADVCVGQITFQRVYDFYTQYYIQQDADSGYIIGGNNTYTKLDKYGDSVWTKSLSNVHGIYNIRQVSDSGYIFSATATDNLGRDEAILGKTNQQGDTLWTKPFFTQQWGRGGASALESFTGGYVLCSNDDGGGASNPCILTGTDSAGNFLWDTHVEGSGGGGPLERTFDSCYVTASVDFAAQITSSMHLTKTDRNGINQWRKFYTDSLGQRAYNPNSVSQNSDSTYIIGGSYSLHDSAGITNGMLLMKADQNGDSIWSKVYLFGNSIVDVEEDCQGGYMALGYSYTSPRSFLMSLDANGDTLWTREINGLGYASLSAIQKTKDNGFVIIGLTTDTIALHSYTHVIKTDCYGNTTPLVTGIPSAIQNPQSEITISPNPARHQLTITTSIPKPQTSNPFLLIHDAMGKLIYSHSPLLWRGAGGEAIDISTWHPGIYFYELINNDGRSAGKFVVE